MRSAELTRDLTTGPIWKNILFFAAPLLLSSLAQQLYNTIDLICAGRLIGKHAAAAIGSSTLIISCLVGFFSGMSVGSGIVVAQAFGAGDRERLGRALHCTVALALAGGALLMACGYALAPLLLRWLHTPEHLRSLALGYLRIYFLSFPAILVYNLGAGVLRALGDSRSPLAAQFRGGLLNVIMDLALIKAMDNGVDSVAWASLFSQTTAAFLVLRRLTKLDPVYALRLKRIAFDEPLVGEILALGVPSGIQATVITLSNLAVQFHINSLGENAMAAFAAYFKAELLLYMPQIAFGQAVMTFTGQNWGAKKYNRMRAGARSALLMSVPLTVVSAALSLAFGKTLFALFSADDAVITLARQAIAVSYPFYFVFCFIEVFAGSLRGTGCVRPPMLVALGNFCLLRPALLWLIVLRWPSVRGVAAVYPLTWLTTAFCLAVFYFRYQKRLPGRAL